LTFLYLFEAFRPFAATTLVVSLFVIPTTTMSTVQINWRLRFLLQTMDGSPSIRYSMITPIGAQCLPTIASMTNYSRLIYYYKEKIKCHESSIAGI